MKEDLPVGNAIVAVAHASLACYLKFHDSEEMATWLAGPFFKAVCKVSSQDFEAAKSCHDHVVITESRLNDQEVALAFRPREEWPKSFKFFSLYR